MQRVQVGNRQCVAILFVIPVIIDICGHRFEVFTLVSEIHNNVDLVLGMRNVFELEGVIDIRDSFSNFWTDQYHFLKGTGSIETKRRKFIKIEVPFVEEISGLAIVKMLDRKEHCTVVLKLKFCKKSSIIGCHK